MKNMIIIVAGLFCSTAAFAGDVFINGQAVRGLTNLTLEGCTVTFNGKGDVHITAPGFKVLPTAATGDQTQQQFSPSPNLKNRYFLFSQASGPGQVPYHYELWINDQQVKRFTSTDVPLGIELTLYMKPGANKIEVRSFHEPDKTGSALDTYALQIGRGAPAEGTLEIKEILLTYTRKGSDSGDSVDAFQVEAK